MAILTSSDKAKYFSEVTATGDTLDGLLIVAQAMCESEYGAGRPLDSTIFTDIVEIYPSSGIAFLKRSPIQSIVSVYIRGLDSNFGSSGEWQELTTDDYSVDTEINQLNIKTLTNWGMAGRRRSPMMEAKVTYYSGFNFGFDTSQEVTNIQAICGRIVSYMEQPIAIGKANITDTAGFQSYVSTDNFLANFLFPLNKYKPRG